MKTQKIPEILRYYDYRRFLLDWYEFKKSINKNYTYRFIAMKVNIDVGYLSKVFHGKKHLSSESIPLFSKLLSLDEKQTEYFDLLLLFGKEKKEEKLKQYFEQLLAFSSPNKKTITADKYEFYKKWYYSAIRELINVIDFSDDYSLITNNLIPQISIRDARRAINLLTRLGFIKKDENGFYRQQERYITTGDKWGSIAIRSYHRDLINLAHDSVSNIDPEERDLSNMTLSLSEDGFKKLKDRARQFREEAFAICKNDGDAERVYEVNMQLFPVSKKI